MLWKAIQKNKLSDKLSCVEVWKRVALIVLSYGLLVCALIGMKAADEEWIQRCASVLFVLGGCFGWHVILSFIRNEKKRVIWSNIVAVVCLALALVSIFGTPMAVLFR